ncbi:hypothetical protein FRB99_004034, partial [Tulasnella sp. 403]
MVWNNSLLVATLVIALVAAAPASTSPSARSSTHELRHIGRSQPIDENWLINYRHLVESKYNLASGPSRRQVANSISLVNFNKDYIYYTSLAVGTPPVEYNVILDTGSSDLWLVAAACRAGCPAIAKTYSSVGSTTFNATGSQPFGIAYFGGSVNGTTAREAMSMNGVAVSSQPFGQVTNFAGGALPTTATGLMGLAWGRLAQIGTPFWENSATSAPGWDQPLFAFALSRQSNNPAANGEAPGGSFTIGAVNPALYTGDIDWERVIMLVTAAISVGGTVVELGSQLAAIDTGTTLIGGPPDAVAKLYSGIPGVQQGTGDSSGYYYFPWVHSTPSAADLTMVSLRNSLHRRTHRERAQPLNRQKLGILEKEKDHLERAHRYHRKQGVLNRLKEKAADRNRDEFYFAMTHEKTNRGVHVKTKKNASLSTDIAAVLKAQDANYIRTMKRANARRIASLKAQLAAMANLVNSAAFRKIGQPDEALSYKPPNHRKELTKPPPEEPIELGWINDGANDNEETGGDNSSTPSPAQLAKAKKETKKHRAVLLKELAARLERDKHLRYAEQELDMQRLTMAGKGAKRKLGDGGQLFQEEEEEEFAMRPASMAPSKKIVDPSSSKGKATGTQASLKNFGFKGGSTPKKASVKPTTEEEDDLNDDDGDEEEEEEEEISTGKATKGTKKVGRPDLSDLPPMTNIPDIFADLVKHIPDMIKVAKTLKGRKLRVATMCSGTESPLLALNLIARALKKNHGVELQFEHVFSCEIVPWKQAYIERNFKPPILFRDVTELGYEEATTAYGAKAPVPIDVDMLIAGTSCVDYSTLNNQKQGFDAKGESGETFRGMKRWVERAKPPIVILENVCGAPWSRVVREFEEIDYSAAFSRFDTKNYYIPHTRTRVYLFAVRIPQDASRPQKWLETVKSLQRPASAPYDAFLLQTDDPRIQQGREKLIKEDQNRQRLIDWAKCETRHARARMEEGLGNKRPLTNWSENGTCKMQDFAWIDWANAQVDRVWDLMDISFMRGAVEGYDPTYKSILWNLSQNVDRQIGSSVRGISPCLTPTMIAYLNYRGGPMLGLEALHLQGLPVDELVLTRETEDNLSDLAGNAMSSTVVGAAMMAAMCLCRDMLDEEVPPAEPEDQEMHPAEEAEVAHRLTTPGEDNIRGLDQLSEAPLDLAKTRDVGLQEMLTRAEASSRLCACEGRTGMSSNELWRCRDCDHTVCSRCGGRPEHDFFTIDTLSNPRIRPLTFSKEATDALPMLIRVSGVDQQALDAARTTTKGSIPDSTWKSFSKAVLAATATDLSFRSLKRQEIWVAEFDSASAFLRFQMDPKEPQWLLYAKPDASEPTNSPVRHMLAYPIARLKLTDKLAEGKWELALPLASSFKIEIKGVPQAGEDEGLSDSWERRLGLQKDEFKDKKVWANLRITVPQESKSLLDEDIDGDYRWLPKCAAANASLHVKEGTDPTKPSIFFFLDPSRWGENDTDSFVFSSTFRRCEYGETRPVYAIVDPKWRQSDTMKTETMSCTVLHRWVALDGMSLQTSGSKDAVYSAPTGSLDFKVDVEACKSAQAILACQVRLGEEVNENIWPLDEWREVDKVHERVVFQAIAFLMERLRDVAGQGEWISTSFAKGQPNCDLCSPPPPVLHWVLDKKGKGKKAIGVEDAEQAGVFERALKNRPSPFITQLMRDEDSIGHVRIGINIASLTHRAVDRLPSEGRQNPISTSYRITINYMPPAKLNRPKFTLKSNRRDPEHSQPPHFRIDLRPEQSRSLTWMLAQEQADVAEFEEEEIVEAILEPLGWRAEAKASRMVRVRGGVLADEVGYGKTVITLGLVACSEAEDWVRPKPRETKGLIAVKGTLVIVPPHLVKQWESEVRKFTGNRFEVIAIPGLAQLKKHSIKDIQNAQLVIVASNLFSSAKYLESLGAYAGAGALPGNYGRYFRDRLQKTLEGVRNQTELLQEEGASAVWEKILEGEKIDTSLQQKEEAMAPSKRLRGQKFREMAEARAKDKGSEATTTSADPETKASGSRQQMLDVYIDVLADDIRASYQSQQGSAASSRVSASSDEGGRSARRKAKAIVESDDDDDDDDV